MPASLSDQVTHSWPPLLGGANAPTLIGLQLTEAMPLVAGVQVEHGTRERVQRNRTCRRLAGARDQDGRHVYEG